MKPTFIAILLLLSTTLFAQTKQPKPNTVIDAKGNYIAIKTTASESIATGLVFKNEDNTTLPIFKSSTGKLFILKMSKKTNKPYRKYLIL